MSNKSQTGVGLVDSSILSLSGSSQQLMAENPSRGALQIMNTGSANIGVRFVPLGGTRTDYPAAIAGIGTFTIVPGGSYEPDGGWIPQNAIEVIGTAAQPVACSYSV